MGALGEKRRGEVMFMFRCFWLLGDIQLIGGVRNMGVFKDKVKRRDLRFWNSRGSHRSTTLSGR